jgi:hypothetical protein
MGERGRGKEVYFSNATVDEYRKQTSQNTVLDLVIIKPC